MKITREAELTFEEFRNGLFSKSGRFNRRELLKLLDDHISRHQSNLLGNDGYGWYKIILNYDMEPVRVEQKHNDKPIVVPIAEVLEKLRYLVEIDEMGSHFELIDKNKE